MFMDATFDEKYQSAVNSSDLTSRGDKPSDTDALAAMAWSRSRIGAALLRLHSEFDGVARRGLTPDQVFGQLKSLAPVRESMLAWAAGQKVERPVDLTAAVLAYWLDDTCRECDGTRWVVLANKPKKPCTGCHGTGKARIPHGGEGRAMLAYIGACIYRGRSSTKARMRP